MIRSVAPVLMALCIAVAAWPAAAQEDEPPPVLVADDVVVTSDRVLIATGNVEVFQGAVRVTARQIIYDPETDGLAFEGPITLRDGADVLILADEAELSPDLRDGLLRSARMVLNQQVQLSAVQINRVGGRYSQLYKSAVTSCHICTPGQAPLWQIRARRIVHDQLERQLYFDDAQLLIRNVPIFYFPHLRLPDPTLERATGFLNPSIRSTSQLGNGVKIPYFIRIGDHRDLTLTPYLSPSTRTLEYRYRQAFRTGRITLNGAVSRDSLLNDTNRWYLFGSGRFDLGGDFKLSFNLRTTSDDAYLKQYDYSQADRLPSNLSFSRTRRDEFLQGRILSFTSLLADESDDTLPTLLLDARYERRHFPRAIPGEVRVSLTTHAHYRSSESLVPGEGRDVVRIHGDIMHLGAYAFASGLVAESQLGVAFDAFETEQDSTFAGRVTELVPQAAVTLRYPLSKTDADGAVHALEPVVQLGWVGNVQAPVANDESTRVEFDEGNLLSLSRFPEYDRREHGARMAYGLTWSRYDPRGWESALSFGQVWRETAIADFSESSGLAGVYSDVLLAGAIRSQQGLAVTGRALLDTGFDISKAELRGDWSTQELTLGGSYLWLMEDAAEDRDIDISELTLDGSYKVDPNWRVSGNWRYDLNDDRTTRTGIGIGYQTECVVVDFSVEHRFTSSTSVEPETSFGFTVNLRGFTTPSATESHSRTCS